MSTILNLLSSEDDEAEGELDKFISSRKKQTPLYTPQEGNGPNDIDEDSDSEQFFTPLSSVKSNSKVEYGVLLGEKPSRKRRKKNHKKKAPPLGATGMKLTSPLPKYHAGGARVSPLKQPKRRKQAIPRDQPKLANLASKRNSVALPPGTGPKKQTTMDMMLKPLLSPVIFNKKKKKIKPTFLDEDEGGLQLSLSLSEEEFEHDEQDYERDYEAFKIKLVPDLLKNEELSNDQLDERVQQLWKFWKSN